MNSIDSDFNELNYNSYNIASEFYIKTRSFFDMITVGFASFNRMVTIDWAINLV